MDIRDAQILARLMANCRVSMRAIAAGLDVSTAAVHKRILALEETGVIRQYRCLVNPRVLGARAIGIFGCSQAPVTREVVERLGAHAAVFQVTTGSHNQVYVTAVVRSANESSEVAGLAHALGLVEPTIRTHCFGRPLPRELTALDCCIAAMLGYKARRPLVEISRKSAIPERVVSRRLEFLRASGALIFTLDLATTVAGGQWSQIDLESNGSHSPEAALRGAATDGTQVLWISRFEETPNQIHAWVWSPSTGALQDFLDRLTSCTRVRRAVAWLLLSTYDYPIWIHEQIEREWRHGSGNGPV